MTEVARMGEAAEPALCAILENKPTLEMRQRALILLDKLMGLPQGEALRNLRGIAVLDAIGTAEARALLADLASGAAGTRATEAARAALTRQRNPRGG